MKLFLERLPKCVLLHSKGRILMLLLLIGGFALQGWAWYYRYPLIAVQQKEMQKVDRLEEEVKRLQDAWSDDEYAAMESNLEARSAQLFTGDPNSSYWSSQINQPTNASSLAIKVASEEGKPHPLHPNALIVVPTLWEIKAGARELDSTLKELLKLLQNLTASQQKRMELTSINVSGNGGALTNAQAGFRLWFRKADEEE